VTDLAGFWGAVAASLGVRWHNRPTSVLERPQMPGATWFPGGSLNYAEHAVAAAGDIISVSATRARATVAGAELADQVARVRGGLRRLGVGRGDRVVAYLPNVAEAVVAFLATASLGAVWASCPPEFGARGVVDRFSQIEPVVLLAVDGYIHRGRSLSRRAEVAEIRAALPTLRATVSLAYPGDGIPGAVPWSDLAGGEPDPGFEPVPFDHPLYVLYSSGTTGLPKPIVHGHGGILVEHLKIHALHHDIGPGDVFFWFSTTGWMMWNYLVSGLVLGASIVCVDGDPGHPDLGWLWRLGAELGITHFGASAPYLMACRKEGLAPEPWTALREIGSTGAPLPADGFDWVYSWAGPSVRLSSVSGGTDVCTAFVGGSPLLPVVRGEISGRCLGAAVEAWDDDGHQVTGSLGNLVITRPMPSMPVRFWGDADGSRYRAAYFDRWPGVWDHGDWITVTDRGTCIITGRSDSTLNRGGVRLGTSDFYAVVEALPDVADSLVVHLEDGDELLLFVVPADGTVVDDRMRAEVRTALRSALSPRHVPNEIIGVDAIPRTLSGKKLEVPVKRILSGMDASTAASKDALADPASLAPFEALALDRRHARS
jgi:acetoacetyl-CoA synthetase